MSQYEFFYRGKFIEKSCSEGYVDTVERLEDLKMGKGA